MFIDLSLQSGQDLTKINFKDQSWLGLKTRSRKFDLLSIIVIIILFDF